ncbi:MAG: adenylyltransferase/cytidyltransferase family protein [Candidatus Niyogibacteria bacterium]|nr:adenylyltransferase/cytidyltransferase family protein [Candidatus Niyogibacteria bacterium]
MRHAQKKKQYRERKKKKIVVAVSGGFDPLHVGHIRFFKEAKKCGDKLIVILNSDNYLYAKKGFVFMPERERGEIIGALRVVDKVVLMRQSGNAKNMSVSNALKKIKPDVFVNGGDRKIKDPFEEAVCRKIGCKMVYVGYLADQSSSRILKNFAKRAK